MKKKSIFGFVLNGEKMTKKELRARIKHIETWLEKGRYKGADLIFKAQKQAAAYRWQLTHFTRRTTRSSAGASRAA